MDKFVVTSTGWGPNYLPQNVAEHLGFFKQAGLEVVRRPQSPWEGVLDDLASGDADIALGGLWVPSMYHGIARNLVCVGQLNGRYAQALVTRSPLPSFDWSWLNGRTVVVPGAGGTAGYTFFTGMMREHGIDPARTRFVRDLTNSMLAELFVGGLGDAFLTDLSTAFRLEQEGKASIVCRLADTCGPVPNSVYYTRRDRLDAINDRLKRFLAAVQRAMNEIKGMKIGELTDIGAAALPHIDRKVLQAVITHVQSTRTWESMYIDRDSYERWIRFQHAIPLMTTLIPYEDLVDTRGMDGAMAALGNMKA